MSFSYTIPADTFYARTKAEANAMAQAEANRIAVRYKFCCETPDLDCCANVALSESYVISLGTGPFTWAITSGALPTGLSMVLTDGGRTMTLDGTPTTPGNSAVEFTITDSTDYAITQTLNILVLGITDTTLPDGQVGFSYSHQLTAAGGTGLNTFSLDSGTLPNGLTLSSAGLISGTPLEPFDDTLTFKVNSCTKELDLTIEPQAFVCPGDETTTLTVASPRSTSYEILRGTSPFYCATSENYVDANREVEINLGEPAMAGGLDTFLFVLVKGQATGGGVNTLTDSSRYWPTDCWSGYYVYLTAGTGAGNRVWIDNNTSDTLLLDALWGGTVDATTEYAIEVDWDDDSGPGGNSYIDFFAPIDETYTFEGTTFAAGWTGDIRMECDCPLNANFTYLPILWCQVGDTVQFTDSTQPTPDTWSWDFGDGSPLDTTQNPSHVFTTPDMAAYPTLCGTRNVTLSVTLGVDNASVVKTVGVKYKYRIKGYISTFFTFMGAGDPVCDHPMTGPEWDGVLESVHSGLFDGYCWWAAGRDTYGQVNVQNQLLQDLRLYRTGTGFRLEFLSSPSTYYYELITASNSPVGVYNEVYAGGGLCWRGPATLEIELAP